MLGVVDVKVTGSPELAVAVAVNGVWSIVWAPGLANVMVWLAGTAGVTAFDSADAGPVPIAFVAVTENR